MEENLTMKMKQGSDTPVCSEIPLNDETKHQAEDKSKRRRLERETELRSLLDPGYTMLADEWKLAKAEHYLSQLSRDQIEGKLGGPYDAMARRILGLPLEQDISTGVNITSQQDNKSKSKPRTCKFSLNDLNKKKNRHIRQQMIRIMQQNTVDGDEKKTSDDGAPEETTGGYIEFATLNETEYYYAKGYRMVWPYSYSYRARSKARWHGRTLRDVVRDEFASFSEEYFDIAQKLGRIKVDGKIVSADHIMDNNSLFTHLVHRHEPAVRDDPIEVVHEDMKRGLMVINKPSTIPVHPCGKFRQNSVVYILARENGIRNVHVVHRLDRATSGLMIMAMNSKSAAEVGEQLRSHMLQKHYLARVRGRFPMSVDDATLVPLPHDEDEESARLHGQQYFTNTNDDTTNPIGGKSGVVMWSGVTALPISPQELPSDFIHTACKDLLINQESSDAASLVFPWRENRAEISVDRPVISICGKYSIFGVGKRDVPENKGKESLTVFRAIEYDAETNTTLVHCMPKTGRTHQIRVHLSHLGYPIANDERYGGVESKVWHELKHLPVNARVIPTPFTNANAEEVDPQIRRAELWEKSYDPFCCFCIDVNAGIWSDRFHFIRNEAEKSIPMTGLTGLTQLKTIPKSELKTATEKIHADVVNSKVESLADFDYSSILRSHQKYIEDAEKLIGEQSDQTTENVERLLESSIPKPHNLIPRLSDGKIDMESFPHVADIDPEREAIWLHAFKYEGPEWTFQVPLPDWAGLGSTTTLTFPPFLSKAALEAYVKHNTGDDSRAKMLDMRYSIQNNLEKFVSTE